MNSNTTTAAPVAQAEPVAWTGGEEWEQLAWHLCAEDCGEESCDELIWEGGPTPEPWGPRWMKYESEAQRMIDLVRKFATPAQPAPGVESNTAAAAPEAPLSNLPSWEECQLRVSNSDFLAKRVAEGGYGAEADSKVATELHRFIYEYDDQAPYRSAWFRHRLEKLLAEIASHGQAPAGATEVRSAPATVREFTNELGNAIRITVEGPRSMHENVVTPMEAEQLREALNEHAQKSASSGVPPACLTCSDHGAVGNILTAEPCPDCTTTAAQAAPAAGAVAGPQHELDGVIAECEHGLPFDATSLATLKRVRDSLAAAPTPAAQAGSGVRTVDSESLYWRLHSLSKLLESSGRIDEQDHRDAYPTILDAMLFARSAQADSWPLKDHQIAALVNELRDIAVKFHGAQQLRERIARVVVPALRVGADSGVQEDAAPVAAMSRQVYVTENMLLWWKELARINPDDLAARISATLDAARATGAKP